MPIAANAIGKFSAWPFATCTTVDFPSITPSGPRAVDSIDHFHVPSGFVDIVDEYRRRMGLLSGLVDGDVLVGGDVDDGDTVGVSQFPDA